MYKICNWDKWQTYRKDRGQPPWIKLHRNLLRNPEWISLTDAQRGQLVVIWLLAADRDGVIMTSDDMIKKLCFIDSKLDMQVFIDKGFIECDATVTPECLPSDAPEVGQNRSSSEEGQKQNISEVVCEWWNSIAKLNGLKTIQSLTKERLKKAKARNLQNKSVQLSIADACSRLGTFAKDSNWFCFDWVIKNDENMMKLLEGNYEEKNNVNRNSSGHNKPDFTDPERYRNF